MEIIVCGNAFAHWAIVRIESAVIAYICPPHGSMMQTNRGEGVVSVRKGADSRLVVVLVSPIRFEPGTLMRIDISLPVYSL